MRTGDTARPPAWSSSVPLSVSSRVANGALNLTSMPCPPTPLCQRERGRAAPVQRGEASFSQVQRGASWRRSSLALSSGADAARRGRPPAARPLRRVAYRQCMSVGSGAAGGPPEPPSPPLPRARLAGLLAAGLLPHLDAPRSDDGQLAGSSEEVACCLLEASGRSSRSIHSWGRKGRAEPSRALWSGSHRSWSGAGAGRSEARRGASHWRRGVASGPAGIWHWSSSLPPQGCLRAGLQGSARLEGLGPDPIRSKRMEQRPSRAEPGQPGPNGAQCSGTAEHSGAQPWVNETCAASRQQRSRLAPTGPHPAPAAHPASPLALLRSAPTVGPPSRRHRLACVLAAAAKRQQRRPGYPVFERF